MKSYKGSEEGTQNCSVLFRKYENYLTTKTKLKIAVNKT